MVSSNQPPPMRAPRLVGAFNPIVTRLMGAGVRLGPNALLTVRGRSTGLPRTFPVALMEAHGRLYVQSPYGDVNWVRNLRADGRAFLARGSSREEVAAIEVAPETAEPILRAALAPYLRGRLSSVFARMFIPLRAEATRAEYIDHVRHHPVFELRPRSSAD